MPLIFGTDQANDILARDRERIRRIEAAEKNTQGDAETDHGMEAMRMRCHAQIVVWRNQHGYPPPPRPVFGVPPAGRESHP